MIAARWPGRVVIVFRERWLAWRNRRLADPDFQRRAARFPFTRAAARRHTAALFDLCAGFVYSQTLLACVQLDVLSILAERALAPAELGARVGLEESAAERLLAAAASLDLVEALGDGRYAPGRLGAALLGNPAVAAMIAHHDRLYTDLADPVALLRDRLSARELARYWGYATRNRPQDLDSAQTAGYTELMGQSQTLIADQVLAACDLSATRDLLDVGGGDGSFAIAAACAYPNLRGRVFDLPAVVPRAARRIAAAGLAARLETASGDFLREPWPRGADLITLVRVLHDHDDQNALGLLRAARAALAPRGRLLIAEPMADTPGGQRVANAYFGFYLWAMGQGRIRSAARLGELLAAAGFDRWRSRPTPIPLLARVIVAG